MPVLRSLFLMLLASVSAAVAQGAPDREHRVKAVFLFNFAQFVDWPDSVFADPDEPLVVGILGDDPFKAYLDEVVRGEKVNNRPIVVKRFRKVEEIKDCEVLFVSPSESPRLEGILSSLKQKHILTVGESEDFQRYGGMVNFATEGGKIRLKINLEQVQEAGLSVSSKLLRLADVSGARRE
ncbi:MAG: YfiR family protein [Fibrobacteres bacterium]|nr:YfiR family protein [Fibrobacterota bacterium]